jgi:hypothetical protein
MMRITSWSRGIGSGEGRSYPLLVLDAVRPYLFHLLCCIYLVVLLDVDAHLTTLAPQYLLGVITFAFLIVATRYSPPAERRQIWLLVGIATCVELFASLLWGVYRYRFGNVPLFVPPGHGLIYLFALRWARTPVMASHGVAVRRLALACAVAWALSGLTLAPLLAGRADLLGALLLPVFVRFMKGPSAAMYAGAFLVTSFLELVGTGFGNWTWHAWAPVIHLPVGNPPSVIAGGYGIMEFATLRLAARLARFPADRPLWLQIVEEWRIDRSVPLPAQPPERVA